MPISDAQKQKAAAAVAATANLKAGSEAKKKAGATTKVKELQRKADQLHAAGMHSSAERLEARIRQQGGTPTNRKE